MLETLKKIAEQSGKILEEQQEVAVRFKDDNSPLTSADLKVNSFIMDQLKKRYPQIPILSEEMTNTFDSDEFFCIDPIDGTSEFLKNIKEPGKWTEFAIMIGYVKNGHPIVGVVHQPAENKTYYAEKGKGAYIKHDDKVRQIMTKESRDIIVGRFNIDDDLKTFLNKKYKKDISKVSTGGSFGVKVCKVAEGLYDSFVHTGYDTKKAHASIWDSCAADVILAEAGGRSHDIKNLENIKYNPMNVSLEKGYIASSVKRKTVLVFDVDGVLGDFSILKEKRDVAHITAVAKKKSISYEEAHKLFFSTKEELKKKGRFSTIDTMNELGISRPEFFDIMNSVPVEGGIEMTKDVDKILSKLSNEYAIVALTNTPHIANINTLRYLGVLEHFDAIYSIDIYNFAKPYPPIFSKIMDDFSAEEGYSIGDSVEKDLIPAKIQGLSTIRFGKGKNEYVDFDSEDMLEILRFITDVKFRAKMKNSEVSSDQI